MEVAQRRLDSANEKYQRARADAFRALVKTSGGFTCVPPAKKK